MIGFCDLLLLGKLRLDALVSVFIRNPIPSFQSIANYRIVCRHGPNFVVLLLQPAFEKQRHEHSYKWDSGVFFNSALALAQDGWMNDPI